MCYETFIDNNGSVQQLKTQHLGQAIRHGIDSKTDFAVYMTNDAGWQMELIDINSIHGNNFFDDKHKKAYYDNLYQVSEF